MMLTTAGGFAVALVAALLVPLPVRGAAPPLPRATRTNPIRVSNCWQLRSEFPESGI